MMLNKLTGVLIFVMITVNVVAQETGRFTDTRDGKVYKTVKIGDQIWMSENMAYKTAGGCWAYNNDESIVKTYGYLYNWKSLSLVAPAGWHVATNEEWQILIDKLGGWEEAGEKLKSTTGWTENKGTNDVGFSGLPGGKRGTGESFSKLGSYGQWWTSTIYKDVRVGLFRGLGGFISNTTGGLEDKENAFSVRCIKNATAAKSANTTAKTTLGKKNITTDENISKAKPDSKPQIPVPANYAEKYMFSEGMAPVTLNHKFGYIDSSNRVVTPLIYDYVYDFSDGLGAVKKNQKIGFVNNKGILVIPLKYDAIFIGYSYGLAAVKLNGKWGFIDKKGNTLIPFNYDETMNFHEGLVPVKLNGKWGYFDTKGKLIVPFTYDSGASFFNGFAIVKMNGKYGVINEKAVEIVPVEYDDTYGLVNDKFRMVKNGQYVYFDKTGKKMD